MSTRRRSASRERITRVTDTVGSGLVLDPYKLLEQLLEHLRDTDAPLVVHLTDGTVTVEYSLGSFLSRDYEVIDGFVKFGFRRLELERLSVDIKFELNIDN